MAGVPDAVFASNYMIEPKWFADALPALTAATQSVTVCLGDRRTDPAKVQAFLGARCAARRVSVCSPAVEAFGTHHSKASGCQRGLRSWRERCVGCGRRVAGTKAGGAALHPPHPALDPSTTWPQFFLLSWPAGGRLVVATGNFLAREYTFKTQGVWWQDFPVKARRVVGVGWETGVGRAARGPLPCSPFPPDTLPGRRLPPAQPRGRRRRAYSVRVCPAGAGAACGHRGRAGSTRRGTRLVVSAGRPGGVRAGDALRRVVEVVKGAWYKERRRLGTRLAAAECTLKRPTLKQQPQARTLTAGARAAWGPCWPRLPAFTPTYRRRPWSTNAPPWAP